MKIPEEALPGLRATLAIDSTSFNALVAAIGSTAPSLTIEGFLKKVSKQIEAVPLGDISSILEMASGLYWVKFEGEDSPHDLSVAVSDAVAEMLPKGERLTGEQKTTLADRLEQLLLLDKSLGVTAKAADVLTEAERTYTEARILSDIRPVFTDSVKSASAGVIMHNLRIDCHMRGGHQEFFFTLDSYDLEQLKNAIIRAERKAEALKAILANSKMCNLEK